MAILKLRPSCKDYIWGGKRLITQFGKNAPGDILAESWELSCHPDGPCYIENGEYAGKTLQEYILSEGRNVLGRNCREFEQFPVLIKFIDAAQNLSVQVHPSDAYALKNEHQYGKTEMWYVMDCEENSSLYYGFARDVSLDEFKKRIQEHSLLEVLNKVYVKKGDVLFIEAGTIHAIGKGCLIAEIQQNSNLTYRVYDYGRKGKDGKERELHIEKALQVTKRTPIVRRKSFSPHIASCKYFTVDKLTLDGTLFQRIFGNVDESTFASFLILNGEGRICTQTEQIHFRSGDSILIPAGSGAYEIEGFCEALVTTI